MILSEGRQQHLAHLVIDGIWKEDLVDYTDEDRAMRVGKKAVVQFVREMMDVDVKARESVARLKRNVVEGSPEWDVMYRKYYEEEMNRRGIS